MDDSLAFRLEEFRALRKEIDFYIEEFSTQTRYAVIAVGGVWSFLYLHKPASHSLELAVWAIPVVLLLAILIRSLAMSMHIKVISGYIRAIEDSFGVRGWEHTAHSGAMGMANLTLTWMLLGLSVLGLVSSWRHFFGS